MGRLRDIPYPRHCRGSATRSDPLGTKLRESRCRPDAGTVLLVQIVRGSDPYIEGRRCGFEPGVKRTIQKRAYDFQEKLRSDWLSQEHASGDWASLLMRRRHVDDRDVGAEAPGLDGERPSVISPRQADVREKELERAAQLEQVHSLLSRLNRGDDQSRCRQNSLDDIAGKLIVFDQQYGHVIYPLKQHDHCFASAALRQVLTSFRSAVLYHTSAVCCFRRR